MKEEFGDAKITSEQDSIIFIKLTRSIITIMVLKIYRLVENLIYIGLHLDLGTLWNI